MQKSITDLLVYKISAKKKPRSQAVEISNETNRYNQYCMVWSLIELGKGNL